MALKTLLTGDGKSIYLVDIVQTYIEHVSHAIPVDGSITEKSTESSIKISVTMEAKSCAELKPVKYNVNFAAGECIDEHVPQDQRVICVKSDDCKYTAIIKNIDDNKQVFQVFRKQRLIFDQELDSIFIITCVPFSFFSWNKQKFLFCAQAKELKSSGFFGPLPTKECVLSETKECVLSETKGSSTGLPLKKANWGEKFSDIEHTVIAIFDTATLQFQYIERKDFSLARPQWLNDGKHVVAVAYAEKPRQLGLEACANKRSSIIILDVEDSSVYKNIEDPSMAYHTLRVSADGTKMVFLSNKVLGPHNLSKNLEVYIFGDSSHHRVLSEKFIRDLPKRCFSEDSTCIVMVSHDHINDYFTVLNLVDKSDVKTIKYDSIQILDFKYNYALVSIQSINKCGDVQLIKVETQRCEILSSSSNLITGYTFNNIEYIEHELETQNGCISAILVSPKIENSCDLPTICMIHGGPHANFGKFYNPVLPMYASLGLRCLLLNYRGSSGCSQKFIDELCGNIGVYDVDDCLTLISNLIDGKILDPTKLVVFGGSHGGFLACHLSCQSDIQFKCAIIRNPVTHLASMFMTTDIPEWISSTCFNKSFDFDYRLTTKELVRTEEISPFSKINKACLPTFMFLGNQDLRVPMYQGERWVDCLRRRGIEVKCKVYNDNHSLGKMETHSDVFIESCVFMLEHL